MFEQRIYGRARESFVRSDGVSVRLGHGYLAESSGFSRIGTRVNDMVGQFPTPLTDIFGASPTILVKKRVPFDNNGGEAALIQQTVLDAGDRASAITHQVVAMPESVTDFVRRPDLWMGIHFADGPYNWAHLTLPSTQNMPVSRTVRIESLCDVLGFFRMSSNTFVSCLCSLFDAVSAGNSNVYTVIAFSCETPNYNAWIRSLIVYIYYFLPFSMRRRLGFETWMTGILASDSCALHFAEARYLYQNGARYAVLVNPALPPVDLYDAFLFWGDGFRHRDGTAAPGENYAHATAYRAFIAPWVAAAYADGAASAERVNRLNTSCWEIFDRSPIGHNVLSPNVGFAQLSAYQMMLEGRFSLPSAQELTKYSDFAKALGEAGSAALASVIRRDLTSTALSGMAQRCGQSESERLRTELNALFHQLAETSDTSLSPNAVFGTATEKAMADAADALMEHCPPERGWLSALLSLSQRGLITVNPEIWLAVLTQFTERPLSQDDQLLLARTAAGEIAPSGERLPDEHVRTAAANRLIELLPENMKLDEHTLRLAHTVQASDQAGHIAACIAARLCGSWEDYAQSCGEIVQALPQAEARSALLNAIASTEPPRSIAAFIDALEQIAAVLNDDASMRRLLSVTEGFLRPLHLSLDQASALLLRLHALFGGSMLPLGQTLLENAVSPANIDALYEPANIESAAPDELIAAFASCEEPLRLTLAQKLLSNDMLSASDTLTLIGKSLIRHAEYRSLIIDWLNGSMALEADAESLLNALDACPEDESLETLLADLLEKRVLPVSGGADALRTRIARIAHLRVPLRYRLTTTLLKRLDASTETLHALDALDNSSINEAVADMLLDFGLHALDGEHITLPRFNALTALSALLARSKYALQSQALADALTKALAQSLPTDNRENAPAYAQSLVHMSGARQAIAHLCIDYCSGESALRVMLPLLHDCSDRDELIRQIMRACRAADNPNGYAAVITEPPCPLPEGCAEESMHRLAQKQAALSSAALCRLLKASTELNTADDDLCVLLEHGVADNGCITEISQMTHALSDSRNRHADALLDFIQRCVSVTPLTRNAMDYWLIATKGDQKNAREAVLQMLCEAWLPAVAEDAWWSQRTLLAFPSENVRHAAEANLAAWLDSVPLGEKLPLLAAMPDTALPQIEKTVSRVPDDPDTLFLLEKLLAAQSKRIQYAAAVRGQELISRLDIDTLLLCAAHIDRCPHFAGVINTALLDKARRDCWSERAVTLFTAPLTLWMNRVSPAALNTHGVMSVIDVLTAAYEGEADKAMLSGWLLGHLRPVSNAGIMLMTDLMRFPPSNGRNQAIQAALSQSAESFRGLSGEQCVQWINEIFPCSPVLEKNLLAAAEGWIRAFCCTPSPRLNALLLEKSQNAPDEAVRCSATTCLAVSLAQSLHSAADLIGCLNNLIRLGLSLARAHALAAKACLAAPRAPQLIAGLFQLLRASIKAEMQNTARTEAMIPALDWFIALNAENETVASSKGLYTCLRPFVTHPKMLHNVLKQLEKNERAADYARALELALKHWPADADALSECTHFLLYQTKYPAYPWAVQAMGRMSFPYRQWLRGYVHAMAQAAFSVSSAEFDRFFDRRTTPENIFARWPEIIEKSPFASMFSEGFAALCEAYVSAARHTNPASREPIALPAPFEASLLGRLDFEKLPALYSENTFISIESVALISFFQEKSARPAIDLPAILDEFVTLFPASCHEKAQALLPDAAVFVCRLLMISPKAKHIVPLRQSLMLWTCSDKLAAAYCDELFLQNADVQRLETPIKLLRSWKKSAPDRETRIYACLESSLQSRRFCYNPALFKQLAAAWNAASKAGEI